MTATLTAKFDGKPLLPESPVDLKPDTRYVLLVKEELPAEAPTAWEILECMAGTVPGPPDWSVNLDHYLYGVPKKEDRR